MKRVVWTKVICEEGAFNKRNVTFDAWNKKGDLLGGLNYERTGRFMHWCWHQYESISMSPGCLQEVRDKQKELLKNGKV